MSSPGEHNLICEINHGESLINFTPFKVVINAMCRYCDDFESPDMEIIANHIIEKHFDSVYTVPLYDDIQPLLPHLPKGIYQCIFCPEDNPTYVKSSSHSPEEIIIRHIEHEHQGETNIFRVLNEIKEIEEVISIEIPVYKKCKLCNNLIREFDLARHLFRTFHKNDIIRS
jgi:hypothetical protein